jgi:hypothetical protein
MGGGWGGPSYWLISTPSWLLKREVLEKVGPFDERLRSYDDWELGLRLWQACRFIQVDQPLWYQDWFRADSGMVFNELSQANDLVLIGDKHAELWTNKRRVRARHYYFIGKTWCFHKSPRDGIPWLLRSLALWPFRLRAYFVLAIALLGRDVTIRATTWWRASRSALWRAVLFWKRDRTTAVS